MGSNSGATERSMKYILVTGGVISGVGKGIISSSLGVILKSHGYRVSAIKIDPYINIDAGTFSPHEHGEVYVLDDGGEVDLDLGNYERFLGVRLTRDNNITTGKIYKQVIDKERLGSYLGKTVQVIPHITDAIMEWVARVAKIPVDNSGKQPHICIIELGGTVGDIEGMPFAEAFRQFQFRVQSHNFFNVHVSLVPEPKSTGEQKTKPTQNGVRELRTSGLSPDLVVCRSETALTASTKAKLSMFCQVTPEQVIDVHDVTNIYHVPLVLYNQNVLKIIEERLKLHEISDHCRAQMTTSIEHWRNLANICDRFHETVRIALVGKYVQLEDAYTSVIKALKHAAIHVNRKLIIDFINSEDLEENHRSEKPANYYKAWSQLTSAEGVLVPGGFGERGIEGKITACKWAREHNIPFLGICLGMQCAAIEFARNVCGINGANSTEFSKNLVGKEQQIVIDMPEHSPEEGRGMGATMRLGRRTSVFLTTHSKLYALYDSKLSISERHRHRYEVNPALVPMLARKGLHFVGMGVDEGSNNLTVIDEVRRTDSSSALLKLAADNVAIKDQTIADLLDKIDELCHKGGTGTDRTAVRMEIVELKNHPYFVGVQFHPEYLSSPMKPSPPFLGLLLGASKQLDGFLNGTRVPSPMTLLGGSMSSAMIIPRAKSASSSTEELSPLSKTAP
uniref:CTP synthase n=1 Tax=Plectus sambesii TaxID=2011161 RepID=A0A914W0E6_9BILA